MTTLRPELPPLPERIKRLPVHRGYPVPWFVEWIDTPDGPVPDFRIMDGRKYKLAVETHRCWVCGGQLGSFLAFNIGPMCAVNRISSEPPSHRECAEFSVRACPFLSRPHMVRRESGLPENYTEAPGTMLKRNPGVALIWVTKSYRLIHPKPGPHTTDNTLLFIGPPTSIACYAEGRPATVEEIRASVESGLPILRAEVEPKGKQFVDHLEGQIMAARRLLKIA